MALLQNFSTSRNSDESFTVVVESDLGGDSLAGATVEWSVYDMSFGVPLMSPQLIFKSSATTGVTILASPPMTFVIDLNHADTADLDLGVYYHEAIIIDAGGHRTPAVMYGAMAVTLSME